MKPINLEHELFDKFYGDIHYKYSKVMYDEVEYILNVRIQDIITTSFGHWLNNSKGILDNQLKKDLNEAT